MKNANLGWLFYREYFRDYDYRLQQSKKDKEYSDKFFARKNRLLYGFSLENYQHETAYATLPAAHFPGFELVTDYPGLLIGTGYNHDIAAVGATKMGFYFDHTTGLPTVPGSSIKGILRSAFPGKDLERGKAENLELAKGKQAYITSILTELGLAEAAVADPFVANLEALLFDGKRPDGTQVTMRERFVCHDAVVTGTKGALMGPDFITPHKGKLTEEPNPIQLLKVMPGVHFRFTFQVGSNAGGEYPLSGKQIIALAKRLLLDLGVGAKTNVGYGQLTDPNAPAKPAARKGATGTSKAGGGTVVADLPVFSPTADKWVKAFSLNPNRPPKANAKVLRKLSERSVEVQILVSGLSDKTPVKCELKIFTEALPTPGQWVEVQIKSFAGKKASAKQFLLKDNQFELIGKS